MVNPGQFHFLAAAWVFCVVSMMLPMHKARSEESAIKATASTEELRTNEAFRITVEAHGISVGEPMLPECDGIRINPIPAYRRDTSNMVNYHMERSIVRMYDARTFRDGLLRIPPIRIEIDGEIHESAPLSLQVEPDSMLIRPKRSSRMPSPTPTETVLSPTREEWVHVLSSPDKLDAYVNEPILLRLLCIEDKNTPMRFQDIRITEPAVEGFYVIRLDDSVLQPDAKTAWDQERYSIRHERLYALYPAAAGQLSVGTWQYAGQTYIETAQGGIERKEFQAEAEPVAIQVKPLPEPPAAFSGAVGQFKLRGDMGAGVSPVGTPADFHLTIVGNGNPNAISPPEFPPIDGASVSRPETRVRPISLSSEPAFEKVFIYQITPHTAGQIQIPALDFCYFDPTLEHYVTEQAGPFTLTATSNGAVTNEKPLVVEKEEDEDIRPIMNIAGSLRPKHDDTLEIATWLLPPAFVFGCFLAIQFARRRKPGESACVRARRARTRAQHRLYARHREHDPTERAYHALMGYIADKYAVEAASLTPQDAGRMLEQHQLENGLRAQIVDLLRECERTRYAGEGLSSMAVKSLAHRVETTMDALDAAFERKA